MTAKEKLQQIQSFTEKDLLKNILPYWIKYVPDNQNGGFYGRITNDQVIDHTAEKGAILNARILYTFSSAYRIYRNELYKAMADRAFNYIIKHFIDNQYGGIYWSVDYLGQPSDTKKQFYAIAFGIYALAEYYRISLNERALQEALNLFGIIEEMAFDTVNNGYIEALSRDWKPLNDMRLSAKDMNVAKSMNTHLHIIEAYTNLYRIHKDSLLHGKLINLYDIFRKTIVNPETHHLILFFDNEWKPKSDIVSYGHDIEASWLLLEAAEVSGDHERVNDAGRLAVKIVEAVYEGIDQEGGLQYEYEAGKGFISDREWWPQAEAVVGFLNVFRLTGNEKYLDSALKSCDIIKNHIIDYKNGEWFFRVDANGKPLWKEDKVGFWKCPYHNSRMAFEIKERMEKEDFGQRQ
ncbi:MAG: AGE family epimerase/isomerase [Bacteroidales bacterium]|nr:AGE family epimerase/isomerase [Bacteroidales bacterium]MBN2764250.1 AGE family epimerase/isomerase [Bacteroidales bacterium]